MLTKLYKMMIMVADQDMASGEINQDQFLDILGILSTRISLLKHLSSFILDFIGMLTTRISLLKHLSSSLEDLISFNLTATKLNDKLRVGIRDPC